MELASWHPSCSHQGLSAVCGVTTFSWIDYVCFRHSTSHNFLITTIKVQTPFSTFFCSVAAKSKQTDGQSVTSFCYKGYQRPITVLLPKRIRSVLAEGLSEPTLNGNTAVSPSTGVGSYFIVAHSRLRWLALGNYVSFMVLIKIRHFISTNNMQQQVDNDTKKWQTRLGVSCLLYRASLW